MDNSIASSATINSTIDSTNFSLFSTSYWSFNSSNETAETYVNSTYCFHGYPVVVPLAIFMIAFMIFAIVGNIMVIMTIVRHRGMRTRTNMFIVNLAVADILVAVLDMPVSLITVVEGDWVFGDPLCQLNGFTMALFLICSIHTLMYISIHKYISITRPFSRAMTPRRIKMMIAAAWLWSIICATGPLVGWNTISYKEGASQCGPSLPKEWKAFSHSLFITTSNYIIPLVVMSFCYYRIFREISDHMNRIRETSNINLQNSVSQQKKISVTLFLVLACFLICWTPFVIYSTAVAFMKEKDKMPSIINPLAYWCGYMNSACNPVIYAFRSPSFRQGYKETITCGTRLSTISGDSFRSRSARGSAKANSNAISGSTRNSHRRQGQRIDRKQKRFLSQTSWMSLPIIPYLVRSMSSASSSSRNHKTNRQISRNRCDSITKENGPIAEENESGCNFSEDTECRYNTKGQKGSKTQKELRRNESNIYLKDDSSEPQKTNLSEDKTVDLNNTTDVSGTEHHNVNSSLQNLNTTSKPPLIQQISVDQTDVTIENCNRTKDSTNEASRLEQTDDLPLSSSLSDNVV